jgi:tetratricopeptide (TPR) repeat protein
MSRLRHLLAVALLCPLIPATARAQADTASDVNSCYLASGDAKIRICTRAIESGKLSPRDLSITLVNRAGEFRNRGEVERELADINAALRADSTNTQAYIARARYYRRHGQETEALRDYEYVIHLPIEEGDDRANSFLNRARAFGDQKEYAEALVDLDSVLTLRRGYLAAYLMRASIYESRREYARAIEEYTAAMEATSRTASLFKDRGDAYFNSAHYPEALTDYDSALVLEPDVASRYADRAQLERYLGQFDQVVTDYTRAIRLEPKRAIRYIARAQAYQQQGDWADAMADFNTAVQIEPDRGFVWDDRADAWEYRDDYVRALADREATIRVEPRDVDWRVSRAWTLLYLGRTADALNAFGEAIAMDSLAAERYRSRASALLYLGRFDQATADFDKAITLEPGAGGGYDERSAVALYRRQPLVGLVDLGRAEVLDKNYEASAGRARLELAAGQLDDAIRDYTAFIARRPNNPVGFEGRGLALMVKGDFAHALEDLRRSRDYGAFSADRELWIHFSAMRGGQNAQAETARRAAFYDPKHWPAAAFELALGKRTVASMIAAAHDTSALMTRDQLSEAYTFAGEYYLALKRPIDAAAMFQKAMAQGFADSFVDIVASAELHALKKQ